MRLGEIRSANLRSAAPAEPSADSVSAETGRALVALEPISAARATHNHDRSTRYRQAPFLAQLIATKDQHPQTRERRRADPSDAIAAYRAMAKLKA